MASKIGYVDASTQTQVTVQPKSTVLSIIVKANDGTPITGATVTSTAQPSGQAALSGTSDDNGLITFTGVLEGDYTVKVSKVGFDDGTWTGAVSSGQTTTQTVMLSVQSTPFPFVWVGAGGAVTIVVIAAILIIRMRKPAPR